VNGLSEPTYRIKLKRGDYEIEVQGDKVWVETKYKELTTSEIISLPITSQPSSATVKVSRFPESLAEFVKSKGSPNKHSTLVVIFGYWLFHKGNEKSFGVKDIAKCYDDARIPESTNTSQYMNEAQGKGFFKRADEKKEKQVAWTITQSGDEFVEKAQWIGDKTEPETETEAKKIRKKKSAKFVQSVEPVVVDLKGDGKPSLKEFFKEKKPKTSMEQLTVFAYYLSKFLNIKEMQLGHVVTCCQEVKTKIPANIRQQFKNTQHRYGWLDAGKRAEFASITTLGINLVEHDLPRKEDAESDKAAT
jgi:hypothetical protein